MSLRSDAVTFLFNDIEGSTNLARDHFEIFQGGPTEGGKITTEEALDLALKT